MRWNATCPTHHISTHALQDWESKFGHLKETLLLYSITHTFLEMVIEGDELYTKVNKNVPPAESEGWTISLIDRASRFIWELTCDKKQERLFLQAMERLVEVEPRRQQPEPKKTGKRYPAAGRERWGAAVVGRRAHLNLNLKGVHHGRRRARNQGRIGASSMTLFDIFDSPRRRSD